MELSQETRERIESLVKSSRVFVFMKGSKTFPQCGFSGAVVGALKELNVDFETFDVLKDPEIRQGIKAFSDWPTIPQVYINEEFVGGSDIIREMTTSGELQEMLGIEVEEVEPPTITVTDTAVDAITAASEDEQGIIRIIISSDFRYQITSCCEHLSASFFFLDMSQQSGSQVPSNLHSGPCLRTCCQHQVALPSLIWR